MFPPSGDQIVTPAPSTSGSDIHCGVDIFRCEVKLPVAPEYTQDCKYLSIVFKVTFNCKTK